MFNKDFYPTPINLINKMLDSIDFKEINSILEPSAGKGDIVEVVKNKYKYRYSSYNWLEKEKQLDIDCIEIDDNLQHILKGKNFRVVHNDFLTFESYKKYDLIVANFPFSEGDKHLLKAIEIQERTGGKIVCLINAETIKNPYSNTRKDLLQKLEDYNANIEYIQNAFVDAERKTPVEVALIRLNIEKENSYSVIIDELKREEYYTTENCYNSNNKLVNGDFIKGVVEQYNFEIKAGLKLIDEYRALDKQMFKGINLYISTDKNKNTENDNLHNSYIKNVRAKYWTSLFENDKFMKNFTSNLKSEYMSKINELCNYDFSIYNIYSIRIQLNKQMIKAVEDTIMNLFEEFSHKYSWYEETTNNIHYYNGWKTNQAWKINKKVIIPLSGFRDLQYSWGCYNPTQWKVLDKLNDIQKVFDYLDDGETENISVEEVLKTAEHYQETKKIQLKYFTITFYKKGTCHIEFTNERLLKKFNLFGSQKKGWIPPTYGKKQYKDMTQEEKQVINDFEGEKSYNEVMKDTNYYIVESEKLLLLAN